MEKLLLVQLLVDRGMDVDEAYNLVFGFGRFEKMMEHVLLGLVEEEVFDGVGVA
jgi:hypothetical protein